MQKKKANKTNKQEQQQQQKKPRQTNVAMLTKQWIKDLENI